MEHLSSKYGNQGLIAASLKVVKRLKFIFVLLLIIEVFLNCITIVNSFDFPWQFAEGQYLIDHGRVAHSVLNSYGEISPQFENEYILYELLICVIDRVTGWTGLSVFFALLAFFIYVPCLWVFYRSGHRYVLIDVCLFMLGHLLISMRLSARPELIADICFIFTAMMLMNWQNRSWTGTQALALGLVFCIWANAHGTFLLGGAMLGLWYVQLLIFQWRDLLSNRNFRWLLPGLAAAIGCAVNPFGFYRYLQPFKLHSLLWGQATSSEMLPVGSGAFLLTPIWTGGAILVLLLRARDRKYYWLVAMLVLLQCMTFWSIRYNVFIGLSLLVVAWDGLKHPRESYSPPILSLSFALARLALYFSLVLIFCNLIQYLVAGKIELIRDYARDAYPKNPLPLPSSYYWMISHPDQDYNILPYLVGGSISQMPGIHGIHSLIDSGTHRYSDRNNELYYYSFYSPDIFRRILSNLNINAVAVNKANPSWATALNTDPDWQLAQVEEDSQLYLRKKDPNQDMGRKLFLQWESKNPDFAKASPDLAAEIILRGLYLRPDTESLQMLTTTNDVLWLEDPEINYVEEWLRQVSDDLAVKALDSIRDKTNNSQVALQLALLLKLHREQEAADLARRWHPAHLSLNYQHLEMLRAETLLRGGDPKAARAILDSFWPVPRYSLRWACLCQQVYANDPNAMPRNARLLVELGDQIPWQDEIIATLNQNIKRLSAATPHSAH